MPEWKQEISNRLEHLNIEPTRRAAITEELSQHLADCYADLLARGATPAEAERQTRAELSEGDLLARELRRLQNRITPERIVPGSPRRSRLVTDLWHEVRYSTRALLKQPGFTLVAILTLALGIGANTAIFSVVNATLLRTLPYPDAERLVELNLVNPKVEHAVRNLGRADFLAIREHAQSLDSVAAISPGNQFSLTGRATPEQVIGAVVSADFFATLGVSAARGRTFFSNEDRPGSERLVVVSHRFWQEKLGSDASVIGQAITLNNEKHTIIGVMPPEFRLALIGPSELWTTLQIPPPQARPPYFLRVIARLKPGATEDQARADLSTVAAQVERQYPNSGLSQIRVRPLQQAIIGDAQKPLLVLLAAVFFVLLMASVNVANLLLARATGREREMAVRAALGASRWRLARQLLTESLVLAVFGAACGLLLAFWGIKLITAFAPDNLPRLNETNIDLRVLGFAAVSTLISAVVFGLAPAWQSSRINLNVALKEGGRGGTESAGKRRLRGVLIVVEVALALVLLIGAGLMTRSFLQLQKVNPGFNPDNVLTMSLALPRARYPEASRVAAFHRDLLQKLDALPGVQAAALSMSLPPDLLMMNNPFTVDGKPPQNGEPQPVAQQLLISPGFFEVLGIRLQSGRQFSDGDHQTAPPVVIINETLARRYFPDGQAVGRRLQTGDYSPQSPWVTIVGVVDDVKYTGLHDEPHTTMYTPFLQNLWWRSMFVSLRTSSEPAALASAASKAVWEVDKDLPVTQIRTMEQLFYASVAEPRALTQLLMLFGAVALVLAASGIYGVMAYSVTQRTREIGIRMAMGAERGDVLRLIVFEAMKLVVPGVVFGAIGAFALLRLMRSLLFGVTTGDPLTFAVIALLLVCVALMACWIPARRATRVDPLVALRCD